MKHQLIINARVITAEKILPDHCIEIKDGKIAVVFPCERLQALEEGVEIFDAKGAYAAAGLIDMHIHGFAGFGPELASEEALLYMSEALAKNGVTAFCPTLYCGQPADMLRRIQNTVGAFGKEKGAHILGYHLEGPFISPKKPGVMKPQDISLIDIPALERLYDAAQGHITNMTVAPELHGIELLVKYCKEHHILMQAGHTDATYAEFLHGASLGITHTTHAFNAMREFSHREPGAAGAVLMHPEISAEIIADGKHVHPDVVAFLARVKPPENLVLITDALRPTGQPQPPFTANDEDVILQDGVWRRTSDQVIAGSSLTLLQGVKNLVSFGLTLPQAAACASANPARLLGLKNKGSLATAMDADMTLFDADFRPVRTFLA